MAIFRQGRASVKRDLYFEPDELPRRVHVVDAAQLEDGLSAVTVLEPALLYSERAGRTFAVPQLDGF